MLTQGERILKRLKRGKASAWELVAKMGIINHTGRISELRSEGYDIRNQIKVVKGVHWSTYFLVG